MHRRASLAASARRGIVLAVSALAVSLAAVGVSVAGQPEKTSFTGIGWSNGLAQPQSNGEAQGVVVDDVLYQFGGFDSKKACCTPTNRTYRYDPASNAWQPLAPMPPENGTSFGGVTHAGIATDGRDIYWAGGYTSDAAGTGQIFGTREVWKYTVATNIYSRMPDLPVERAAGQLEYLDGKLHYFGGTNLTRTQDVGDHYVLDLAGGATSWTTAAPLANPRHHMGSAVLGGKIYAVGGQHGHDAASVTLRDVDAYNPATDSWSAAPADFGGTTGRSHISGATFVYGGRIIVAGGEYADGKPIPHVTAYNPATNQWIPLTQMPAPRRSGIAAALGTRLYYATGYTAGVYRGVPQAMSFCAGWSDLPCSAIKAARFPFSTSFSGTDGGLYDRQEDDLGLPLTQPSSNGGAYRPESLDVAGGTLALRTSAGLQFKRDDGVGPTENSLDNAVGIGLEGGRRMRVETALVNPPLGSGASEQAGIWLGPGEDNYVKVVLISTPTGRRVQLLREIDGASATTDAVDAGPLPADLPLVRLAMVVDPGGTVSGSYEIGSGPPQNVGSLTIPARFLDGSLLPANVFNTGVRVPAGLFASHRNATSQLTYRFRDFGVVDPDAPAGTPNLEFTSERFIANDPIGGPDGPAHSVTIRNTGGGYLRINEAQIDGPDANQFKISRTPSVAVPGGGSTVAEVSFAPTTLGPKRAWLHVSTEDPDVPQIDVPLRGLGTRGLGGANEPSLQWILDTHDIPVDVGDDDVTTGAIQSEPMRQRSPLLGEEIAAQLFERAGAGEVTVEPLAVFGPDWENPAVRLGTVPAGAPGTKSELFTVRNAPVTNAQTIDVPITGSRSFTPATQRFGFYTVWPAFAGREVFQEDALNTFAGAAGHQVRVYRYKDPAGVVVPDAYVVAFEEFGSGMDTQDMVFVVRNVRAVRLPSQPKLEAINLDTAPFNDRLIFNRIQSPDVLKPNAVHDTGVLQVHNQSAETLTLKSIAVDAPWELVAPTAVPVTLGPGEYVDVKVRFTPQEIGTRGGLYDGSLTIDTDDPARPRISTELSGFWQSVSEQNDEPTVQELLKAFGYRTRLVSGAQNLSSGGQLMRVGEEVNSQYWRQASTDRPVYVRQLAAMHTQGNTADLFTTLKATADNSPASPPPSIRRLTHYGLDAQSFLPRRNDAVPGVPAFGEFFGPFDPIAAQSGTTTGVDPDDGTFGLRIDSEYGDWRMNKTGDGIDTECLDRQATDPTVVCGHHVRTWPIRDRAGLIVPNTWLVIMDYAGINYDFNDNVYLISNMKPEDPAIDPTLCRPVACDKVAVDRPYALTFDAGQPGTVEDRNGAGTGFTWIDPTTWGRGYVKDNLEVAGGRLRLTTTAGRNITNLNNQDNALAVGMDWNADPTPRSQLISTRLVDIPQMNVKNEQAGLWFGRDEDNYVSLHVWSNSVNPQLEFLKEQDGVVTERFVSPRFNTLTGQSLDLKIELDPGTQRATARWNLPGQATQTLGTVSLPPSWFDQVPASVDGRTGTSSFAGIFGSHRHGTIPLTFNFEDFSIAPTGAAATRPKVTAVRPADESTGVSRDTSIGTDLSLPQGGINDATLSDETVRLFRVADEARIAGTPGTTGGGDAVIFTPELTLDPNTQYRFEVTSGLRDVSGIPFEPFTSRFTTGTQTDGTGAAGVRFEHVPVPNATGPYEFYTGTTVGPDGMLYAALNDGRIRRFGVHADGTLDPPETITSLVPNYNPADPSTQRLVVGFRFDPASTRDNLIAWVSHTTYGFNDMPDWGGKITRLSGSHLEQAQDYVVGLPRSVRDHVTNGIDFGPDGKLYVLQGSTSAMGGADTTWGSRPERLLSAAVLQVDPARIPVPPVNVQTEEGGTYDPRPATAPVRLYATGLRNAFDLVWHTNGRLYVPTNGSAAGGNTPATPSPLPPACSQRVDSASAGNYTGPAVPGLSSVSQTQADYLFRVVPNGYYGHPNPTRCEWVLNGGNPTSGVDPAQVSAYPVGTQPDRNWRGAAYDFGLNKSPNGIIEYKSNAFGGRLQNDLLAVRYSQNDDIVVLHPDGPNGDIAGADIGTAGLTGFKDPLDLAELPGAGYLYVAEYDQSGTGQRLTLLRPFGACVPISPMPCTDARVANGRSLTWESAPTPAGLQDNSGAPTGFTAVQPNGAGGAMNAYRPERVEVRNGRLNITALPGIQYRTPATTTGESNLLENALGFPVAATQKMRFETTVVNPRLTGRSEQAGIWLGPDQDDYVKLVVVGTTTAGGVKHHKVQLLREVDGNSTASDEANWPATGETLPTPPPDWSNTTVRLVLEADPASGVAEAWYGIGGGALQRLGALTLDPKLLNGTLLPENARGAGIRNVGGLFASRRASTDPTTFSFESFSYSSTGNAPPAVDPIADRTSNPGASVSFSASATDPEGDALTWSASGLPAGVAIDSASGAIGGTIASSAARSAPYDVTVTATDPAGATGTAGFHWKVNQPPAVAPLGDRTNNPGTSVSFAASATDADGDAVSWSATGLPGGISINPTTGTISGTVAADAGRATPYQVTVVATDPGGASGSSSFAWRINQPPAVTSVSNRSDEAGTTVGFNVSASDPDGGALTYSASGLPSGVAINSTTGRISGVIATTAASTTPYDVTVRATDPDGAMGTTSFQWTVTPFRMADVRVNFQSQSAALPSGYLIDYGQAFGARSGANQGNGLSYGWISPATGTALDLSNPGNGRDRNVITDQRLDTLLYMQANQIKGSFSGTKTEGAWEIAVPSASYDVTVAVGDASATVDPLTGKSTESHSIRVETNQLISGFVPTGSAGSATRHTTRSARVAVTDGRLTVSPVGGTNTKIHYIELRRVVGS